MFEDGLTEAEVKAIAKNRGFPTSSGSLRSSVKNLFLSSVGIDQVLASLAADELTTLRLLTEQDAETYEIGIDFFERLYHEPGFDFRNVFMLTYNQRYGSTLKAVRERLIKKGVLIFYAPYEAGSSRIERWRFMVPPCVVERLPPYIKPVRLEPTSAEETNLQPLTIKLLELCGVKQKDPMAEEKLYSLKMKNGVIYCGQHPLDEGLLYDWQINNWARSLSMKIVSQASLPAHPIEMILNALIPLSPKDWFSPRQFNPLMKVALFGFETPGIETILDTAWQWGLLARTVRENQVYYRTNFIYNKNGPTYRTALVDPSQFIFQKNERTWVDLEHAPAAAVAILNRIASFELQNKRLYFTPHPNNMVNGFPKITNDPFLVWIVTELPEFRTLYDHIRQKWGKTVVHQNLLYARVTSYALMVQIERAFQPGTEYVRLSDEWIAFPKLLLPEIEKLVNKHQFVVKKVNA